MENIPNKMTEEENLQTSPEATNDASAAAEEEVTATKEQPRETEAQSNKPTETTETPAEEEKPSELQEPAPEPVAEIPLETPIETATEKGTEGEETGNFLQEEDTPKEYSVPETKEAVIDRLKVLEEHPEQSEKAELDLLKQTFYKLLKEEKVKNHAAFIKEGGKEEDYIPTLEPLEEQFKKIMTIIKEQRTKLQQAAEKQKELNLEKKQAILEKIKKFCTTPEEANQSYDLFRNLQNEWRNIKPVPATATAELWKNYQFYTEQFYDLLKTNIALRDYDFKKNLAAKTKLCEEAEKLADDQDIVHASRTLQELHQEFREIGPVAKDLREELWNRFKQASSAVNKKHAQYFEKIKENEEDNLKKKTEICEKIENIETANLQNFSAWDNISKKIIELQNEWRSIGHTTKKMNNKIYERYRAACDNFFNKKTDFFKTQRKIFAENTARKTELCKEAEALKDSTDWAKTTEALIELQKAWKETGTAAHRVSTALWERFNNACNTFFDQKKKIFGDLHKEEHENLSKKKSIIEELKKMAENTEEATTERIHQFMEEWNNTGHVPFKDKNDIYAAYREICDVLSKKFNLRGLRQTSSPRNNNVQRGNNQQSHEGNSLFRLYEAKKSELNTYENNFSFLSAHSKRGNALIDNLKKKIDSLKNEVEDILQKIKEQEQQTHQQIEEPKVDSQKHETQKAEEKPAENATEASEIETKKE